MTSTVVNLHHVHDFVLTSDTPHDDPFGVNLLATFGCDCGRKVERLPGFFDGDGRWIVCFRPNGDGHAT